MQRRRANQEKLQRKQKESRNVLEDTWSNVDQFTLDHVNEVLIRLQDGSLDDDIWGKIVIMERGCRIAKAYLRHSTLIIDGGDEEFDGHTLGFNHFRSPISDTHTTELREKIGDGVIIKFDSGNVKAMAMGSTPIIVQGLRDNQAKNACASDRLIRSQGRLPIRSEIENDKNTDNIVKMKKLRKALETFKGQSQTETQKLLFKACVRVALVKDGQSADITKTPCWFMIINVIAVDMIRETLMHLSTSTSNNLSATISSSSKIDSSIPNAITPADLTQLLITAVSQQQRITETGEQGLSALSQLKPGSGNKSGITKKVKSGKNPWRNTQLLAHGSISDSDDGDALPSSEDSSTHHDSISCCSSSMSSNRSNSIGLNEPKVGNQFNLPERKSYRPRLDTMLKLYTEKNSASTTTSGYDSHEIFDTGSWSSGESRNTDTDFTRDLHSYENEEEEEIENNNYGEFKTGLSMETSEREDSIYTWTNSTLGCMNKAEEGDGLLADGSLSLHSACLPNSSFYPKLFHVRSVARKPTQLIVHTHANSPALCDNQAVCVDQPEQPISTSCWKDMSDVAAAAQLPALSRPAHRKRINSDSDASDLSGSLISSTSATCPSMPRQLKKQVKSPIEMQRTNYVTQRAGRPGLPRYPPFQSADRKAFHWPMFYDLQVPQWCQPQDLIARLRRSVSVHYGTPEILACAPRIGPTPPVTALRH